MDGQTNVTERVKRVIAEVLGLPINPQKITDDELLFGGALGLDSVATLELVIGVEREFDITVEDEELTIELFENVRSMANYVQAKLGSSSLCGAY